MSSGYNPLFLPTFDLDVEALCTLGGPGGSATVEVLPAGALRPPVQYFDRCLDHCWIIFDLFFWRYMMYIWCISDVYVMYMWCIYIYMYMWCICDVYVMYMFVSCMLSIWFPLSMKSSKNIWFLRFFHWLKWLLQRLGFKSGPAVSILSLSFFGLWGLHGGLPWWGTQWICQDLMQTQTMWLGWNQIHQQHCARALDQSRLTYDAMHEFSPVLVNFPWQ